jgi:hypothetical protein
MTDRCDRSYLRISNDGGTVADLNPSQLKRYEKDKDFAKRNPKPSTNNTAIPASHQSPAQSSNYDSQAPIIRAHTSKKLDPLLQPKLGSPQPMLHPFLPTPFMRTLLSFPLPHPIPLFPHPHPKPPHPMLHHGLTMNGPRGNLMDGLMMLGKQINPRILPLDGLITTFRNLG